MITGYQTQISSGAQPIHFLATISSPCFISHSARPLTELGGSVHIARSDAVIDRLNGLVVCHEPLRRFAVKNRKFAPMIAWADEPTVPRKRDGASETIMSTSTDPDELQDVWVGYRISPPMRERYARWVEAGNKGAREMGFRDLSTMWREGYDMTPEEFSAEVERLWQQVKPLYESLHAYVRGKLVEKYGRRFVLKR